MRLPTQLLRRKVNAHKGDFGHIFILAGSARFSGAALLCAEAAMRSGAGFLTLGIPKSLNFALLKRKPKEIMTLPIAETKAGSLSLSGYRRVRDFIKEIDILVIGPGLGSEKSTQALVRKLVGSVNKPMIIDADGLNALVGHLKILRTPNSRLQTKILTPHPGEMSRLINKSIKEVQGNRKALANNFAKKYKVTLVLKGHNTIVRDYRGNCYINKTGNPGMASAGTGDVLTGIIAAFLGQGLDAFSAAKYAVYLHGLAGDLAAREKTQLGLIASDLIDKLPQAIKKCS